MARQRKQYLLRIPQELYDIYETWAGDQFRSVNAQIEATWTAEMVHAFLKLGERYPDIAAEIYVVAKLPEPRHR